MKTLKSLSTIYKNIKPTIFELLWNLNLYRPFKPNDYVTMPIHFSRVKVNYTRVRIIRCNRFTGEALIESCYPYGTTKYPGTIFFFTKDLKHNTKNFEFSLRKLLVNIIRR